MIYAYDKAATIPLVDVYDRLMMLAQIAAAKDMYEKGLEEMKEFRKDYGDILFSDPSAQEWYNNNFNVGKFLGDLYKNGIDPLRSAEGRSLVSLYINSRNYGGLNQLRANDANRKLYNASAAKLGSQYDPEFEAWRLGYDPREFRDVDPDGTIKSFDATYAVPYTNLHDMVHPTLAAIKPHLLTSIQAKSRLGDEYDPRNTYEGVTEEDMRNALQQYLPGIRNSMDYKYQRYLAEQDLLRQGKTPTPDKIDEKLVENAIMSDYGITTPLTKKADEWLKAAFDRQTAFTAASIRGGSRTSNTDDKIKWTDRQQRHVFDKYRKVAEDVLNGGKAPSTPSQYYKMLQTTVDGGPDKNTAMSLFVAGASLDAVQSLGGVKRYPISFGNGDLFLTAQKLLEYYRQFVDDSKPLNRFEKIKNLRFAIKNQNKSASPRYIALHGGIMISESQIALDHINQFYDWLEQNKVEGYVPNNNITVNYNAPYGYDVYDINGVMRVNKSDLMAFFKTDENLKKWSKDCGLVLRTADGKRIHIDSEDESKNKQVWDNIVYVDIPVTRSTGGTEFGNSVINTLHDSLFSKTQALKNSVTYQDDDDVDESISGD